MRKLSVLALFGVLLVLGVSASAASADARAVFKATLTGSQVGPPTDTRVGGRAIFKVGKDEASLTCLLNLTGVENPTSAHIHGVDGKKLVNLGESTYEGRFSGIAVQLTIQEDSTELEGEVTLREVIDSMGEGDTYIDVHSASPDGSIRGRID